MPDQRIDQLNAETTPAAVDLLPVFSIAGADTKKITVKNLIQVGATLIDDASIPGSKVNVTGLLTGAIVNADINANAEIAVSKLVDGTARQLLQTDAAGTGVEWASDIDIPGTLDVTSAATFDSTVAVTGALTKSGSNVVTVGDTGTVTSTMILDGTIVSADINASAAIEDTKLATIATAGKVSNSATTATNANTASAIVARDASGNFTAGTITASLTGNASTVTTNANLTGDITSTGNATSIAAGVIVNADINASAAIEDTKLATIATALKVSNSATTATNLNTASAIVARDASGNFTAGTITAALTGTASGNLITGGALGTPSSGTLTSCTGLPISTGVSGLGTGAATFLTTPSSANLAALLTDETGTGAAVFATSPTLVSPALGTPSSGVLTNCTNLPIATASVVGAMLPGTGLSVTGGGVVNHTNSATAGTTSGITFDAQGHITTTAALVGGDLPVATSGVIGAVRPGTGLTVDGSGILDISAATNIALGGVIAGSDFGISTGTISLATQGGLTAGTYTKATFNSKGIATGGTALVAGDIPNLAASQITSGSLDIARIATNTVTSAKLANYAVTKIGDTQPTADHIGEFFFNPLSRDLFLWDGNVYQPIGISVGEIVFAGTFDASLGSGTGLISSVTTEGTAIGLAIGQALPAPAAGNSRYYLVVAEGGTITTGNAPHVVLAPPDILLSNGITWTEVDVSQTITAQTANNISFTPAGSIVSVNVQSAIQELDDDKLPIAGGTVTGTLEIGTAGSLRFEGATVNDFETIIAVVDPTADRTITLPNTTGTVVTTGDTGTVTSTMLLDGTILNADINASAGIVDTKLATIATAGKVSNSATTATNANTASAIVARDASGNFTAGIITADLTGNASTVTTNANLTGDVTSTGNATAIAAGVIVNADVNASAAIAGSKIAPDFGAQTITTTGVISPALGTAALPSVAFTGDTNTGIFSPGADQVAISTNGVARLTTSTTAVSSSLAIDHPLGAVGTPSITFTGDLNTGFYSPAADTLAAVTGGSNRLHITSGGLVGIGTNSPDTHLHLYASNSSASISFTNTSALKVWQLSPSIPNVANSGFSLYNVTDSTVPLHVTNAGLVGIGITSPATPLHVQGTSPSTFAYSASASGLRIGQNTVGGQAVLINQANADFYLGTNDIERVRIDSSGRLLVGTSSQLGNGIAQFKANTDSSTGEGIIMLAKGDAATAGQSLGQIKFINSTGNQAAWITGEADTGWGGAGSADYPGRLVFSTTADGASSPTERMRIDNQGEVTTTNEKLNLITVGRGAGAISTNTAVGTSALASNTTGTSNTANGLTALFSNTTGGNNTANGVNALYSNTTGTSNTANGLNALYYNTTGGNNTANGLTALQANTTGGNNTANGVNALYSNTTGSENTAIGLEAGYGDGTQANTTGGNNTFIGFDAMGASATASNVITLGNGSIATLRCQVTTITSLSDARDKTNITNLPAGLNFINALRPVAFDWNTRDGKKVGIPEFGFIAQELQEVQASTGITVPNLVSTENPDKLEASAGTLLPVLVNAVQELTAMVRDLQAELSILKGA